MPQKKQAGSETYLGLMSGTSVDSIDAVVVTFTPQRTLKLRATYKHPFPSDIKQEIQTLIQQAGLENALTRLATLDVALGELFADSALQALKSAGLTPKKVRAIGSHGQTLRHAPNGARAFSLQIGNPAVIAERTGITTIADFRRRDIAAGGQGAPLVPGFHQWLFQRPRRTRVILNIGGIANVSYLPAIRSTPILGFDTGPGNTLMDGWMQKHTGKAFDADGTWARTGTIVPNLLAQLMREKYFSLAPPKSTGRELFNLVWLETQRRGLEQEVSAADVQATLCELTALSITQAIEKWSPKAQEIYVCGGGSHNTHLMQRLRIHLNAKVGTTAELGLHPDWVEASAFAWLAYRTLHGIAGNVPSVTGARHTAVLGAIYPA